MFVFYVIVRHADRVKKKVTALERDVIVRSLRHYVISLLQSTAYRFYIAQCVGVIIKCKAMNIKRFDCVFFALITRHANLIYVALCYV